MNPYTVVFLSMLIIGLGLLVFSLLAGELGDLVGGGGDGDLTGDGLSWFSLSTVAVALVGFGVVGLTSTRYTHGLVSVLVGIIAGAAFAFIMRQFVLLPLMRQQSNSHISESSYVGRNASVSVSIPANGWGEVRFTDSNGALVVRRARAPHSGALAAGARVTIDEVSPDHVIVKPVTF